MFTPVHVLKAINRARAQRDPARGDDFNQLDEPADVSMDSDEDDAPMPPVRGRGRGSRARGGRGQSSGSRGRARGIHTLLNTDFFPKC